MPVDHKRINGPELSVPYQLFEKLNTTALTSQFKNLFKSNGARSDGRSSHEHRKIFLKTGVVTKAKGSAYIEQDQTKVIVSVFDPREIPNRNDYSSKGEIYCEFKFAPFSCHKRRLHQQDAEEQHYSVVMKQALESVVSRHEFPNFQVDIYALVLHNDGSALSAAITAAGAALAHAGIPMYDIVTSATISIQGTTSLVDPTLEEENLCQFPLSKDKGTSDHGTIVVAVTSTHEQISQCYQTGYLSFENITESLEILKKATQDIVPLVKKCLVRHVVESTRNEEE